MINDSFKAKLGLFSDQNLYFFANRKRRGRILDPTINTRRACRPTLIIEIDLNHGERACPECVPLLAKGYKEVFTESPISERAEMIHFANFQPSDFADGYFGARIFCVSFVNNIVFNDVYLCKRLCT